MSSDQSYNHGAILAQKSVIFSQIADLPHFSWSHGCLGKHEKLPSFPSWVTETSESSSQLLRLSQKSGEHFSPSSHICPVHVPTVIPKRERLSGRWATGQRQLYKELRILLNPSWGCSIWQSRTGKVHNFIFPWILCTHALPSTEDYGLSRTSCQFCKSTLVAISRVTANEQWRRLLEQVLLCPFCFPRKEPRSLGGLARLSTVPTGLLIQEVFRKFCQFSALLQRLETHTQVSQELSL